MKKIILTFLTAATLVLTPAAFAHKEKHHAKHGYQHSHEQSFTDYAYVSHVSPVYKRAGYCDDHDNSHYYNGTHRLKKEKKHKSSTHGSNKRHDPINKIKGRVHNKHLSISIDIDDDHRHKRRCKIGYDVTYRYHGHSYTTFMKHRPGHRISIEVSIKPL